MAPTVNIGLLLHFYQPWWQFPHVLTRIANECYRPIFRWLDSRQGFAFSANVPWSLLELLHQGGHYDLVDLMRLTASQRRIEPFGTVAYHPIVPLSTEDETARQVEHDRRGKRWIGFPPGIEGFYLPEYAYDERSAAWLSRAGYVYTVADDAAFAAQHGYVPYDHVPKVEGLGIFLRSRQWGNALSWGRYDFDRFRAEFVEGMASWFDGRDGYVILATDAETFGHHHPGLIEKLLRPMVEAWSDPSGPVRIVPFSELFALYGQRPNGDPVPPSSWSTEPHDFVTGNHFPLWNSPDNIYHRALWRLADVARRFVADPAAEEDVLKALSSCCWWQVSGRPNFNPRLMMLGARKALDVIDRVGDEEAKEQGRSAFEALVGLPGVSR